MNDFDDVSVNKSGFAYRDLTQQDRWIEFTPSFTSTFSGGTPGFYGRYRIIGKKCEFQVLIYSGTVNSTAGTAYMSLPITAAGLAGIATMSDDTDLLGVGVCHIKISTTRCYLPTQAASGNDFTICGSYEV